LKAHPASFKTTGAISRDRSKHNEDATRANGKLGTASSRSGADNSMRLPLRARPAYSLIMLLKIIAFLSAAIPLILFARSLLGRRETKLGAAIREAKKQIDLAVTIFLVVVGLVMAFALGRLVWGWWTAA
jgi:hypothetical protein